MRLVGKQLPLPVRVAAGLAVSVAEGARRLPSKIVELPISIVSQALQLSMRMQQQITELAIKGDNALSALQQAEETPKWATFDEDTSRAGSFPGGAADQEDPWTREAMALAAEHRTGEFDIEGIQDPLAAEDADVIALHKEAMRGVPDPSEAEQQVDESPDTALEACPGYRDLSLPQLRARLRGFTVPQLEELLAYERTHAARKDFIGMLTRRIATVRART